MKGPLIVAFALLLHAVPAAAQEGWREDLRADLIAKTDGKYTYEEYGIARIAFPGYDEARFQIKLTSECPADSMISRDNFVALTTAYTTMTLLSTFAEAYQTTAKQFLEAFDYTELDAPIGTPDFEVNLRMTGEGIQLEIVDTSTGTAHRMVQTWEEIYQR